MMAYDSQFVICILHNGRVLRESNRGVVHIPFNGEYKIRLKNKHFSLRAKAKVSVDGRPASNLGDFILQAGETLDLERFLDHSMTEGNRFKFVPLSDGRVADPTDHENGLIKVEFYREKGYEPPRRIPLVKRTPRGFGPIYGGRGAAMGASPTWVNPNYTESVSVNCFASDNLTPVYDSFYPNTDNAGATIEGGHSGQSFVYGDDFPTETYPITLTLRLRGLERSWWEHEGDDGWSGSRKQRRRIKYCPGCGERRRKFEKFCGKCGTAFHPRYERERGRLIR